MPLVEAIRGHVFAAERIHADDTTVPVQAKGKTRTGRLWAYVRDDQPFGGPDPPAAAFFYSPDRGGEHPERHLASYVGLMQADAYAGFNRLYEATRKGGPIIEAACWAHGRRKFFDLARLQKAPIAIEAIERIDALFAVEREINGLAPEQRLAVRNERSRPLVVELESWLRQQRAVSRRSETAKAIDYSLKRWTALTRFLGDGRLCMSNNAAERAVRCVAVLESLCIPSSSVCKHWNRVVVSDATRATFSGHRVFDRLRRQVGGANLVRRAGHNLHRWQRAGFDQAAYCVACGA
jgi:transposase